MKKFRFRRFFFFFAFFSPLLFVRDHGLGDGQGHHVLRVEILADPVDHLLDVGPDRLGFLQQFPPGLVQKQGRVCGVLTPDIFGHRVEAQGDDEELDVALPVGRLRGEDVHVGSEQRVDERVRADEDDLDRGRGLRLGVAELLDLGHQAGEGGADVGRTGGANHSVAAPLGQLGRQVGPLPVARVGQDELVREVIGVAG